MPDLETLLRDVRPTPRPEFTTKLDSRVAARFPGPVPAWKRKLRTLRDHMAALTLVTASGAAALLILIVLVKAVSVGGDDSADGVAMSGGAKTPSTVDLPETSTDSACCLRSSSNPIEPSGSLRTVGRYSPPGRSALQSARPRQGVLLAQPALRRYPHRVVDRIPRSA